ncbi:MAG: TrkA family potassium uptake protein [Clostridia bacterium]
MKTFAVIGIGRFGSNLAKKLYDLGNEVLAIDDNEDRINHISDYVTHAIVGDPQDEAVLRAVGIRNFDCAIVALSDDTQTSILVTMLLKEMGVPYVVAKATSDMHMRVLKKVGADKVVFPEKDMGMKLAQSLAVSNILDFIEISDDYSIIEVNTPKPWVGKSLTQLNIRANFGVTVMVIKYCNSDVIDVSPNPDYVLTENDVLVIIGAHEDITNLTKL